MGYKLNYRDTTFFGLLKIMGWRVINNWSFTWSIFLVGGFILFTIGTDNFKNIPNLSTSLVGILLGASASIFSIVIAALAVTLALFHRRLLPKLLSTKLLHKFLFPFWKAILLWCIAIIACIVIIILDTFNFQELITYPIIFVLFVFCYALFYTVHLAGNVIRNAMQSSQIPE